MSYINIFDKCFIWWGMLKTYTLSLISITSASACNWLLPFVCLCCPVLHFVTLCYSALPFVTLCYPVLPFVILLPSVTFYKPVLPFVTLCYPLLPCDPLCSNVLPCFTLFYPVLPCVTLCYSLLPCVTCVTLSCTKRAALQNDFKKRYKRAVKGLPAPVASFGCLRLQWKALWEQ